MRYVFVVFDCSNRSNRDKGRRFFRVPTPIIHKGDRVKDVTLTISGDIKCTSCQHGGHFLITIWKTEVKPLAKCHVTESKET